MPTFDTAILAAACVLAGLAIAMLVYFLAGNVAPADGRPGADDAHRHRQQREAAGGSWWLGVVHAFLPVMVPVARGLPLGSVRASLSERYARAAWPGGLDDDELVAASLVAGLPVAVFVTALIYLVSPLAAPLGLVAVTFGPGMVSGWLTRRAAHRDSEIRRTMPFVLDLLVLTMRVGAPFNVAMERVAIDYSGHPIGMEFRGVLADMQLGVAKNDALENLASRNPIPAIRTFADDLNQAEELGRPVADTLQRLADQARRRRILDATASAGRAKVLVLIPGVLVFVATLILLFSPFAVRYFYGGYGEF